MPRRTKQSLQERKQRLKENKQKIHTQSQELQVRARLVEKYDIDQIIKKVQLANQEVTPVISENIQKIYKLVRDIESLKEKKKGYSSQIYDNTLFDPQLTEAFFGQVIQEENNHQSFNPVYNRGSRKIRGGLVTLALLMIVNSVGSDQRVGNEDIARIISQLLESLVAASKNTKDTLVNTVNSSIEYYQNSQVAQTYNAAQEGLSNLGASAFHALAIPALKAVGQRRVPGLRDIGVGVVASGAGNFVESKKRRKKKKTRSTKVSDKDLEGILEDVFNGDVNAISNKLQNAINSNSIRAYMLKSHLQSGLSLLYYAANSGKDEVLKVVVDKIIAYDPLLLGEALTKPVNIEGQESVSLYTAANQREHKAIRAMLKPLKDHPKILRDVAMQVCDGGTALFTAIVDGDLKGVIEMIDLIKHDLDLLKDVVMQINPREGKTVLYAAAYNGDPRLIKAILAPFKDHPEYLRDIITQPGSRKTGHSCLHMAAVNDNHEAVKALLGEIKDYPNIMRELILQVGSNGKKSAIYTAAHHGHHKSTRAILESVEDYPDILDDILKDKPKKDSKGHLSVINHLVMSGDFESIKIALKHSNLEVDNLPTFYYSEIPKTAIYYLEAAKGKISTSYFELQNDVLEEVAINDIELSSDKPVLIKLLDKSSSRKSKVVLGSDVYYMHDKKSNVRAVGVQKLKSAIDLALDHKANTIIFNSNSIDNHSITLKLSRGKNKSAKNWNLTIHDSNGLPLKYSEFAKDFCQEAGVNVRILKTNYQIKKPDASHNYPRSFDSLGGEADIILAKVNADGSAQAHYVNPNVIMPNIGGGSEFIKEGVCDMVSSMTASSLILNTVKKGYCKSIREKCISLGMDCIGTLAKEAHIVINNILDERLGSLKEKMKPSSSVHDPETKTRSQVGSRDEL